MKFSADNSFSRIGTVFYEWTYCTQVHVGQQILEEF